MRILLPSFCLILPQPNVCTWSHLIGVTQRTFGLIVVLLLAGTTGPPSVLSSQLVLEKEAQLRTAHMSWPKDDDHYPPLTFSAPTDGTEGATPDHQTVDSDTGCCAWCCSDLPIRRRLCSEQLQRDKEVSTPPALPPPPHHNVITLQGRV